MSDELLTAAEVRAILGVGVNAMTRYLPTIRHFRLGNPRTEILGERGRRHTQADIQRYLAEARRDVERFLSSEPKGVR